MWAKCPGIPRIQGVKVCSIKSAFVPLYVVALGLTSTFSLPRRTVAQGLPDVTLARRFAPVVRLHPDEEYFPSSAEWYLRRVQMRYAIRGRRDRHVLDKGQVTPTSLVTQVFEDQYSGRGYPSEFFLEIPYTAAELSMHPRALQVSDLRKRQQPMWRTRRGRLRDAPCYAHTVATRHGTEIQYWFFYPYNGDIAPVVNFAHEGDWEHVTIRLAPGNEVASDVFYAAHEGGRWYPARQVVNDAGRPIVYSARYTHASYPTAGTWRLRKVGFITVNDATAAGSEWDCASNLVLLSQREPRWIRYTGRWGELGLTPFTTGPRGPALHEGWDGEDGMRPGGLVFREGNRCSQDIIGETNHFPGQRINLPRTHAWENDEARSLQLERVRAGTVIRVFDDAGGSRDDDYTVIKVKANTNRHCIRTFERSWQNSTVRVQFHRHNGLDGKVSRVRVQR
jgi:hypothetical protein